MVQLLPGPNVSNPALLAVASNLAVRPVLSCYIVLVTTHYTTICTGKALSFA